MSSPKIAVPLAEEKMVTLPVKVPESTKRELELYAEFVLAETGQKLKPAVIGKLMIDQLLSTDRGFIHFKKNQRVPNADKGSALNSTPSFEQGG